MCINFETMKIFNAFFLFVITTSCVESQERVEDQVMDCLYATYDDGGKAFREALIDHETDLITENVLADGSGKSYRVIFENVVKTGDFLSTPITNSFSERIMELGQPDLVRFQECEDAIVEPNNPNTKRKQLGKVLDSIMSLRDMNPSLVANGILSVLDESDFEMDYYKMMIYFTLDNVLDKGSGIARSLPSLEEQEASYDASNALEIQIDETNKLFLYDEEIELSKLKGKIIDYVKENPSEPVLRISNHRLTSYGFYITVQNEVIAAKNAIRDEGALTLYGKPMEQLSDSLQREVKKRYPIHLEEGEME